MTEAKLARLLEVARESYDVIVVDTSPFFHGPMLATLDRTDELLLLCGLDVPTLKNVRLSLQTLELLSFPPTRVRVVLNRANSKVGMKRSEVEGALEREDRASSCRATAPCRSRSTAATRPCSPSPGCRLRAGDPRDGEGARRRRPRQQRPAGASSSALWRGRSDGPPRPPQRATRSTNGSTRAGQVVDALAGQVARRAARARRRRPVRRAEDAHPPRVHREARPAALQQTETTERPARARPARRHRAARARPHAAHPRGAAADRPRDHRRHPRLRPARAAAPRRLRDRGHGQRASTGSTSSARARSSGRTSRSSTTRTCCGSSTRSSRRSAGAIDESSPMVDARLPDGSRVNAIIPPLALHGPDADDPEVRARPVHDGRPDRVRDADAEGGAVPRRVRARASSTS